MRDIAPILDQDTGEVHDPAEVAAQYAAAAAAVGDLTREVADVRALLDEARRTADDLRGMLLAVMTPGQAIPVPAGAVVCTHGPRRNATINRDGCEQHQEALVGLGLAEVITPPPPEPKLKPATVSALRAAEADLAIAGVPLTDLVVDGGPGEPIIDIRPVEGGTS